MKMSKKSFIGILVSLIVILLVLAGYAYCKTDLFKSPETLFYKYLAQNLEMYPKMDYSNTLQEINSIKDKDYTKTGNIKIKVDGNSQQVQSMKVLEDLRLDYQTVKVKQDSEAEVKVIYSDNELLKINTKSEDDKFGIKIDGVYDKYIAVQNKNLKELFKKLGMESDEIPDKIETIDLYDLLYVSDEDINTIKQTYKDVITSSITKEKYTIEKNVETTIDNSKVKTNAYKLKLNEKELYEITKNVLETLKNDELLLNLIESKAKKINSENTDFSKEKIKSELDKQINELNLELSDVDEQNYLEIIVYELNGKTVKTDMKLYTDGKEENTISMELKREDNKVIAIVKQVEDGKQTNDFTMTKTESNGDNTKNLEYECNANNEGAKSLIAFKYAKSGDNTNLNIKFGADEVELALEINEKLELTSNKEIEKMNGNNTVILNDKTEEEMVKVFEDVVTNVQNILLQKIQLLGINPGLFSGMSNSPMDGIEEDKDAQIYMDLFKKYQNGEITEEQLNRELELLDL